MDYAAVGDVDPALAALIEQLRAAAAKHDIAPITDVLADDLVVAECDSDATRPCPALDPRKKRLRATQIAKLEPPQRLLQSLCCSDMRPRDVPGQFRVDAALDLLRAAVASGSIGSDPDIPDAVCTPAPPAFDRAKALKMAIAADTDPQNLRLASKDVVLRKAPRDDSGEAGRIAARQVAPMVTDLPEPLPDGWTAVALPEGTLGYTHVRALEDLVADSVCFSKNADGKWRIRVVIRRHPWGGPG